MNEVGGELHLNAGSLTVVPVLRRRGSRAGRCVGRVAETYRKKPRLLDERKVVPLDADLPADELVVPTEVVARGQTRECLEVVNQM